MKPKTALLVILALLLPPFAAAAQQAPKLHRIGILSAGVSTASAAPYVEALRTGLRDLGYIEGQNFALEQRYSAGRAEVLTELAAELVRLRVDVILTVGSTITRIAKDATATIPIVMAPAGDPVGLGLVTSLAHPGANVTGISSVNTELSAKGVDLLKEMLPKVSRIALLSSPGYPAANLSIV